MTLQEWVEEKRQELLTEQKYREVEPKYAHRVTMAKNNGMVSTSYALFQRKDVPFDTEVKPFNAELLPDTYKDEERLPVIEVVMEVLRPRKRKKETERYKVLYA